MKEKISIVIHPGEYLRDELKERGITQQEFAKAIGKTVAEVNFVVNKKRGLTPDLAIRISIAFGGDAKTWTNLQAVYDMEKLKRTRIKQYKLIKALT